MADATVNIKLSPQELDVLRFALEEAQRSNGETIKHMAATDGRGLRAMQLSMKTLREKL